MTLQVRGEFLVGDLKGEDTRLALPVGLSTAIARTKGNTEGFSEWSFEPDTSVRFVVARRSGGRSEERNGGTSVFQIPLTWWRRSAVGKGRIPFEFALARNDVTLMEAKALLARSHPRGIPLQGLHLICRWANPHEQRDHFRNAKRHRKEEDPWSPAWGGGIGGVIGCVTIARLLHGSPKGRKELVEVEKLSLDLEQLDRREAVTRLGVVWVSRIAVDAPYRGLGIGTALMKEARTTVAGLMHPDFPRYVEVIRTVGANDAQEAADFICSAGYQRAEVTSRTRPIRQLDDSGQISGSGVSARQRYYWGRVESVKRVPWVRKSQ